MYAFPMLTQEACKMLVEEVDGYNASGLPTSRPNSMNKYGLVLNEIGMAGWSKSPSWWCHGWPPRAPPAAS